MFIRRFQQLPIRRKLLAMALLPLVVVLPLLGVMLLLWSNAAFDQLLLTKIRSDLAVAHGYFERVVGEVAAGTAAAAGSRDLHRVLERSDREALRQWLDTERARLGFDFLNLRNPSGDLRVTDWSAAPPPDPQLDRREQTRPPPQAQAQAQRSVNAGSLVRLQAQDLARIAPDAAERADIPLVATLNAAPTSRLREQRALVVQASIAVLDERGGPIATLHGGMLLNRNLPFIDHINSIVYPQGSLPFGSQGTATLFLDDVRVTTNVRLFGADGEQRAIGTRVSQAVRDAVLGRGETWLSSAFVVNDWYVSAYEPLSDASGQRVGMLYVGFLERPFIWVKYAMLASLGLVFFAVMGLAAAFSLRAAREVFRPIERMTQTMERVGAGELSARVGAVSSGDEIGQLAGHLDHLLDVIDENTRALQRWNAELDAKVAERTRDLAAAQQQLVRSEKLAAIGQLTASIAHEVNNPIAVIQGNLDLVRELLGPRAQPVRAELALVDAQIERMRLIVTQLLQFARPTEYAGYVEAVDPAQALESSLLLVSRQLAKSHIDVRRDFGTRQPVGINRQELEQVLINLMLNAMQAMNGGGVLTLATRDWNGYGVSIQVIDSGTGLSDELLAELFQPFVTGKKDGTGLGLWISRSLVERYGGDIRARNRDDGQPGAVFEVLLRFDPDADLPAGLEAAAAAV